MGEYEKYFNGERYAKANTIKSKARAERAKKTLQTDGYNVRILDGINGGYNIYYRKKTWK
jgi:hypothetical protein